MYHVYVYVLMHQACTRLMEQITSAFEERMASRSALGLMQASKRPINVKLLSNYLLPSVCTLLNCFQQTLRRLRVYRLVSKIIPTFQSGVLLCLRGAFGSDADWQPKGRWFESHRGL